MGRFHRHDDGTVHDHEHADHEHADHEHDHSDHEHHHAHGDHQHSHAHTHDGDHAHDHDHDHNTAHLGDHSGYETGRQRIEILEDIFAENDHLAAHNREAFDAHGITAINVMSSPGAGKTTLLARTLDALSGRLRVGVIEGDIETGIDADRLAGRGAQISLLNTGNGFGGECHLDAPMVARAITGLDLDALDLVIIENVGNLVCPAEFEVGEHRKAMVYAITEGEDKPLKYPVMFRAVDAVVVNKVDLAPYLDFDLDLFKANLAKVNPGVQLFELSAKSGQGVDAWVDWVSRAEPAASNPL